jgi:alpha-tubulin suppressor-like RCC1 family protein
VLIILLQLPAEKSVRWLPPDPQQIKRDYSQRVQQGDVAVGRRANRHSMHSSVLTGFQENAHSFTNSVSFADAGNVVLKMLACGRRHALALFEDGSVYAWGEHRYGQLVQMSVLLRVSYIYIAGCFW